MFTMKNSQTMGGDKHAKRVSVVGTRACARFGALGFVIPSSFVTRTSLLRS